MKHLEFIELLGTHCNRAYYYNNPSSVNNSYIEWVFDHCEFDYELFNFLYSKLQTKSWNAHYRKESSPNPDGLFITGKVRYTPITKKYFEDAVNVTKATVFDMFTEVKLTRDTSITDMDVHRAEEVLRNEDDIIDAACYAARYIETISRTYKENEMPINDDNDTFEVKSILRVDIGGYEYDVNTDDPKAEDVKHIFEDAIALLEKTEEEADRLYKISDGKVPSVVAEEYSTKIKALQDLITMLNEL